MRVDGDFAEEGNGGLGGELAAAAVTEDLIALAVVADEIAHVLDDAQDRHLHLAEHLHALARVDQADLLWLGHDDSAVDGDVLRKGQMGVAGAGRHVDDQIIERRPVEAHHELLEVLVDHWPAQDQRLLRLDEEAHRQQLDAVGDKRQLGRLLIDLAGNAHHQRNARSVDVGIEQADGVALSMERQGEVGGHG